MTNEEAVEKLKILKEDYWDDDGYGHESKLYDDTALALDMAIKALEDSRWIPVTERLPEEYASYYTTIQYRESKARDVAVLCYDPEDKEWLEIWGLGCEVVAWMPLPKQYEGE